MNTVEKDRGGEPLVNFRNLRRFFVYPVLAVLVVWFGSIWLPDVFTGLSINRDRMNDLSPLLEKAGTFGLTYEKVLADPASAEGKPVTWCVRNRSSFDVVADGDENKRLAVSNYPAMPLFSGSKHEACTRMLLLVEKAVPGRPVPVFFKEAI